MGPTPIDLDVQLGQVPECPKKLHPSPNPSNLYLKFYKIGLFAPLLIYLLVFAFYNTKDDRKTVNLII